MTIYSIIEKALERDPSDIHISAGMVPYCRCAGRLVELDLPATTEEETLAAAHQLLTQAQFAQLEAEGEVDVSLSVPDAVVTALEQDMPEEDQQPGTRLRLNVFRQRGSYAMAFRVLNKHIPNFEELGLPQSQMEHFCTLTSGLVLVTGSTGTGKTTTISAMVDWMNRNRACHIITIEDPIEYFHEHQKAIVHQREIGRDTTSFGSALRSALRQDPDVIFIGEMRDLESISIALTAAETGHLVLSTLHTIGSAKTIDRIIDVFPDSQQQQVRTQLSMVLQGILSQQLLPSIDGRRRELATELLMMTPAVRNLIRENRIPQIPNAILTGAAQGMRSMDANLLQLVQQGRVHAEEARLYASAPDRFDELVRRG